MRLSVFTSLAVVLMCNTSIAQVSSSNVESVDYSANLNTYYFSNNSAGSIRQMDASGTVTDLVGADGSHGLEVIGDTLYACDGTRLKGYQLPSGTQIMNVAISGASFLNGITHKGDDIFFTDFSGGKIYRMNRWTEAYNTYVSSTPSTPNGIIYDDISDRLVYVSWGGGADIYQIDLSDSTVSLAVSTTLGNLDGIHIDCSGNFYVSSWSPQRISKFSNDFAVGPTNMGATGLSSPADIYYNRITDTLAIANSGAGNVSFEYYPDCVPTSVEEVKPIVEFNVSPNPAMNDANVIIESSGAMALKMEIIDIQGAVVMDRMVITSVGRTNHEIDLSELERGIYFVRLESDDFSRAEKLIVQ